MALSLLSNCATLPDVLRTVDAAASSDGQPFIESSIKLLSSQDVNVSCKAATLIGNFCHDKSLRSQVCCIHIL